nr:hypothetical protein [uncultured Celeribacter sp.]
MKLSSLTALSAVTLSLAACGGSSVDRDMADVDLPEEYGYLESFIEDVENEDLDVATNLSGSIVMDGGVVIDVSDEEDEQDGVLVEAIGDLGLEVNFDTPRVDADADNFVIYRGENYAQGESLGGSLSGTGTVTPVNSTTTMTSTLDGMLSAGQGETYEVVMDMDGTFYDNGGQIGVYGSVEGTIAENDDPGEAYEGGFAALEQN